jgi:hypothetical protein
MIDYKEVADAANMIINGYAFTKDDENIKVLNLNNPEMATVLDSAGGVLETTMCDIEIQIVKEYLANNIEFMED